MVTKECRVRAAFLHKPLPFGDFAFYFIRLDDGTEDGADYCNHVQPAIYDASAMPMVLAAELARGSRVRLDVEGRTVRAVQIMQAAYVNPFAVAA